MKTFVISLPNSPRRAEITAALAPLESYDFEFVDGVKFKQAQVEVFKALHAPRLTLRAGDLGCSAAHHKAWERIHAQHIAPYPDIAFTGQLNFLILEDDVTPIFGKNWAQQVIQVEKTLSVKNPDAVILHQFGEDAATPCGSQAILYNAHAIHELLHGNVSIYPHHIDKVLHSLPWVRKHEPKLFVHNKPEPQQSERLRLNRAGGL